MQVIHYAVCTSANTMQYNVYIVHQSHTASKNCFCFFFLSGHHIHSCPLSQLSKKQVCFISQSMTDFGVCQAQMCMSTLTLMCI